MTDRKHRVEIGDVNEAARRYRTDAAGIWAAICSERPRTLSDGRTVLLVADRRRDGSDGPWIVEEIEL